MRAMVNMTDQYSQNTKPTPFRQVSGNNMVHDFYKHSTNPTNSLPSLSHPSNKKEMTVTLERLLMQCHRSPISLVLGHPQKCLLYEHLQETSAEA